MYTQCPECLSVYTITPAQLAQARGDAVCTHCASVFDALRTLREDRPADARQFEAHATAHETPRLTSIVMRPSTRDPEPARTVPAYLAPRPRPLALPAFARMRRATPNLPRRAWLCGIAVLLVLLLAQIGWIERDALLAGASTRPWLDRACAWLARYGCHVPLPHDPDDLVLLSRDVRPHPSVPNALIISATLRNDADHAQAFPIVEITLADLDEHRIAMRRFKPSDYIDDAHTIAAGLPAHASSAITFEVADPGKEAVAYEFKFL